MSRVVRAYDHADRLTRIEHRTAADVLMLSIDYEWNLDNTLFGRTQKECDVLGVLQHTTQMTFGYDARKQLA